MIEFARTAMVAVLLLAVLGCDAQAPATTAEPSQEPAAKLPVKVVVVTMFERGEDEGDEPGEFQFWKERRDLDQRFEFPHSHHDLFYNPESQILGIVTGVGTAKAASSTMALGLDPRFDLTRAYWLVAGIAGIDPEDASIGSAAWSAYLVDGDLGHEIDVREIPDDWPFGYFARRTQRPFPHARCRIARFAWIGPRARGVYGTSQRVEATVRAQRGPHRGADLLAWGAHE
jgi:purine nucleoside permease